MIPPKSSNVIIPSPFGENKMKSWIRYGILSADLEALVMILYLIRHGETSWNHLRKLQGRTDIELNENGRAVAELTRDGFSKVPFDIAFTSPLKRARETAEIILEGRNVPIIDEKRIIEVSFGEFEGTDFNLDDEAIRKFFVQPEEYQSVRGTESMESILSRLKDFWNEISNDENLKDSTILISTHGAALSGLLTVIKGNSVDKYWAGGLHKNCGYSVVEVKDGRVQILKEAITVY